jgi:hypothetical protein
MKVTNMKKYLGFIVAVMMMAPTAAMATVYHCDTDQALEWQHGKLVQNRHLKHGAYRFDDETAMLWEAVNPSLPFGPRQLKLVQKANSGNDLIATSEERSGANIVGETVLHIRSWDEKADRLIFMITEYDNVSSGHCEAK